MDAIKEQIESHRRRWEEFRSDSKVLCKCSTCERAVPLHERQNYVHRRTAAKHARRATGNRSAQSGDSSFYSTQELVTSLTQALGLNYAHTLLQEAVAGQRPQSTEDRAPESPASPTSDDLEAARGFANMFEGMRCCR